MRNRLGQQHQITWIFCKLHSIAFPKPLLQPAVSALLCLICVHVFISHMELSLYFQSCAYSAALWCQWLGHSEGEVLLRVPVECLACFHSWFIEIKPCLWCGGASPTCSQMEEFFLKSQWRCDSGALYFWMKQKASSQKSQGWFWKVWWLLLLSCFWGRGWWGGQCWSVYTQAPGPVGETSLQGPNCTLGILVLLIFKLD